MEFVIYGALIGTAGLFIHIYRLWRERTRLQVIVYPAWEDGGYARGAKSFTHLSFEILNTGRTPVVLRGVGAEGVRREPLTDGTGGTVSEAMLNDEGLPQQLDPGHTCRALSSLPSGVVSGELGIADIWAEDSLGRKYRPPRQRREFVRVEIEQSLASRAT